MNIEIILKVSISVPDTAMLVCRQLTKVMGREAKFHVLSVLRVYYVGNNMKEQIAVWDAIYEETFTEADACEYTAVE